MSQAKWIASTCFAMILGFLSWGCAGTSGAVPPFDEIKGQHPQATWIQDHWAEFLKSPDLCRSCHGSTTDPAQAGGIAKVSCFECHATALPHPAGWADHAQHGRQGAQLAPSTDPMAMAGLAHCAKCHGSDFRGGLANSSCMTCHTKAPHPDRPWRSLNPVASNHDATNINNAAQCFACHANGANSTVVPATPAPAGAAPGCYNATMCHDRNP
jgi:hypothetical protein